MPCYFRRACVEYAVGAVSSYVSNYQNWIDGGKVSKEPTLQVTRASFPTFYNNNMFVRTEDPELIQLKLYSKKDWVWVSVRLKKTDIKYIEKYWSHVSPSAPTLEKRHGKFFLRFSFTEKVDLLETPFEKQTICAVDLGLNTDAVCSIMDAGGTVLARKFINFASEKDHLYHVLNEIKKLQRKYGNINGAVSNKWEYARRLNDELAKHISAEIVDFAKQHGVYCIVFEHLNFKGKIRGRKKQRIAMWKKNSIQTYVEHKAHRFGIHISHVCAWKTSSLAYDGSGEVIRGRKSLTDREIVELVQLRDRKEPLPKDGRPITYTNNQTCTFLNGKEYNCDLNASYNIGAKYFIRSIVNELTDEDKEALFKKIPDAQNTTKRTLSTLWMLNSIKPHVYRTAQAG